MTEAQRADKAEIMELLNFERFCRDNALWEEMRTCYAEDSIVDISWYHGSGDGFVTASKTFHTYAPHVIHSSLTWLNNNRAVTIMMANVQMRQDVDGVECELVTDVQLLFRTEKINGKWFIKNFESIYIQDRINTVLPSAELTIKSSELEKYRKSYAGMSYIAEKKGIKTNHELTGSDRPETVKAIYEKLSRWLDGKE